MILATTRFKIFTTYEALCSGHNIAPYLHKTLWLSILITASEWTHEYLEQSFSLSNYYLPSPSLSLSLLLMLLLYLLTQSINEEAEAQRNKVTFPRSDDRVRLVPWRLVSGPYFEQPDSTRSTVVSLWLKIDDYWGQYLNQLPLGPIPDGSLRFPRYRYTHSYPYKTHS